MKRRAISIHAHFYQPPREDPVSGELPQEEGAHPFNNWNERIYRECYQPNADLGNFARLSFNVGPTLCNWMQRYGPETCEKIAAQDRENVSRYGVGNALAQPYNHTILPLASQSDKRIQIAWGIEEFGHRFGRQPQGMWLPEAAVDLATLKVMSEQGIEFTILAPWQAVSSDLDVTEPYRVTLPHGGEITVFFYHQVLSAGISFRPELTVNADHFVQAQLASAFNAHKYAQGEPQMILLASDGELYGHHQPLRDHFLAHLLNGAATGAGFSPVYPALWLREHPARRFIEIREQTSWSCHHGIERWKSECACTPGQGIWKAAMRNTLNWFATKLDDLYLAWVRPIKPGDPWILLERYIEVMLGQRSLEDLVYELTDRRLYENELIRIQLILAAQVEKQKTFTSCGWFFDDFDRIEPRNNVAYAAKGAYLVRQATGIDLSAPLMKRLKDVRSTRTGLRGDQVFSDVMRRLDGSR